MTKKEVLKTPGRKPIDTDKKALVKMLIAIKEGSRPTYYYQHTLEKLGYIRFEKNEPNGKGRPSKKLVLTGKATSLISLSKTWKVKDVVNEEVEVAA